MKIQLLKATAFALVQAIAVHSENVAVSEEAIKYVAASNAGGSGTSSSKSRKNRSSSSRSSSSSSRSSSSKSNKNRSGSSGSSSSYSKSSKDEMEWPRFKKNEPATTKKGRSSSSSSKSEKDRSSSDRSNSSKSNKDDDTDRRPTDECEDLGETAAEFIVYANVCIPNYGQGYDHGSDETSFDKSCRRVAYGVCQGQLSEKIREYCPDKNVNTSELADLQDMCEDEVDNLTGGYLNVGSASSGGSTSSKANKEKKEKKKHSGGSASSGGSTSSKAEKEKTDKKKRSGPLSSSKAEKVTTTVAPPVKVE